MQQYLQNLLPRIRVFNQALDKKELLIDQPWILVGDNTDKQQFIFRRNGQLLQSVKGHVEMGTWEYIPAAQSLLIQSKSVNLLLNHAFFDKGVLLLKKDGSEESPWVLANERVIPDLDVERYLKNLAGAEEKLGWLKLDSGDELEFEDQFSTGIQQGAIVSINGMAAVDGTYRSNDQQLFLEIRNSSVVQLSVKRQYRTDKGIIVIMKESFNDDLRIGMQVQGLLHPVVDDRYLLEGENLQEKSIDVENGVITNVKYKPNDQVTVVIIAFLLVILIVIIFIVS